MTRQEVIARLRELEEKRKETLAHAKRHGDDIAAAYARSEAAAFYTARRLVEGMEEER